MVVGEFSNPWDSLVHSQSGFVIIFSIFPLEGKDWLSLWGQNDIDGTSEVQMYKEGNFSWDKLWKSTGTWDNWVQGDGDLVYCLLVLNQQVVNCAWFWTGRRGVFQDDYKFKGFHKPGNSPGVPGSQSVSFERWIIAFGQLAPSGMFWANLGELFLTHTVNKLKVI